MTRSALVVFSVLVLVLPLHARTPPHSECGNGDFEAAGFATECAAADGYWTWQALSPLFTHTGFHGGPLTDPNTHQELVTGGSGKTDENVPTLSLVAPVGVTGVLGGSLHAMRIGNALPGSTIPPLLPSSSGGVEKISKTFVASKSVRQTTVPTISRPSRSRRTMTRRTSTSRSISATGKIFWSRNSTHI